MSRNITYPTDINRIILMGGTPLLPKLAGKLLALGYEVIAYTSPRQEAEIGPHDGLHIHVTEDINQDFAYDLITDRTLAIGMGEAWVFGEKIRDALGDRLLDYMSVPLPRYRGGAHISWAIMRGETEWGGCLQLVTANTVPGEVDDGELVSRWSYHVPSCFTTPQEWFDFTGQLDIQCILDFITALHLGDPFATTPVDNTDSLFLPRLRTADNGWIDWRQDIATLTRQICAFDAPYPGARTYLHDAAYGDREVALQGVTWNGIFANPAPYQRGLVLRVADGIHIAAVNGVIVARRVLTNGKDFTDRVKVGMRLHTPTERLESALISTPIYTPKVTAQ